MPIQKKFSPSALAVAFVFSAILFSLFKHTPEKVLGWDNFGYYLYLPAAFIHDDLKIESLQWADSLRKEYDLSGTLYQVHKTENGNHVIQYSCGWGVVMLPAFVAAHLSAEWFGYEADGFSKPYNYSVLLLALVYLFVGLVFLRKILLRFLNDWCAAIVIFLVCMGTNFFFMGIQGTASPHIPLFMLYTLILWHTMEWHKTFRTKNLMALTVSCGLACLIRPSEMVCLLIPLLWTVVGWKSFKEKMTFLFVTHRKAMLVFAAILFFCALPQLLYWKYVTGHFLFMSYTNAGEGFDFLSPHTWNFLFSFRKGWIIYTPLAVFMIVGVGYMVKYLPLAVLATAVFFVINLYIVSSWTTWWYAGSFSSRAMVQSYPVMALALGALVKHIAERKKFVVLFSSIGVLIVALNLFQTWQANHGIIDHYRMTWPAYKSVFFKAEKPDGLDSLLSVNRNFRGETDIRYQHRYDEKIISEIEFSERMKGITFADDSIFHGGPGSGVMNDEIEFLNGFLHPFNTITQKDHCWIEAEVWVLAQTDISSHLKMVCTMKHGDGQYGWRAGEFEEQFIPGQWNKLHMKWLTPEIRSHKDRLFVYLWYKGEVEVRVDDFVVKALVPK